MMQAGEADQEEADQEEGDLDQARLGGMCLRCLSCFLVGWWVLQTNNCIFLHPGLAMSPAKLARENVPILLS